MADTMTAVRFHAGDGQGRLVVEGLPVPRPGPLDVLIRVSACGICLSDVHLVDGSLPPVTDPVVPGHESAGVVEETGAHVEGWQAGDAAVLMGGRQCGACLRCRSGRFEDCLAPEVMGFHYDGAWAEYVVVPFTALTPLPDGVPVEQAAILADAVATPYAALADRAALRPGETVGLWGIGGLGTHAVQIARRLLGAGLVVAVDPLPAARERAVAAGADAALDPADGDVPEAVRDLTGGVGLDVAVDLVGSNEVLSEAVASLTRGGRAVMVGLSVDPVELGPGILFGVQSHSLLGHLGYEKAHLETLVRLLTTGRLDLAASISDVIGLEDVPAGVERLASKDGDPVRIVVRP